MTEPESLQVITTHNDGSAVVTIAGELDLATRDAFASALTALLEEGITRITVDMSGVTFTDSTGLSALLEARRAGAELTLRNPSGHVRKLLELVVIDALVAIEEP